MSNLSLTQCKVRLIKLFLGSNSGWPNPLTVLFELLLKVLLTPIFSLLILWNNIHQMPQKYQNVFFKKHCNSKWSFSLLTICFPFQRKPFTGGTTTFFLFRTISWGYLWHVRLPKKKTNKPLENRQEQNHDHKSARFLKS